MPERSCHPNKADAGLDRHVVEPGLDLVLRRVLRHLLVGEERARATLREVEAVFAHLLRERQEERRHDEQNKRDGNLHDSYGVARVSLRLDLEALHETNWRTVERFNGVDSKSSNVAISYLRPALRRGSIVSRR